MRTTGKQCGLAATGDYQPSLRSPWLAADVDPQSRKFDFIQHLDSMADDLSGPDFLMSALNSVFRRLEVTLTT
ncbi:hypothetical protein [Thiolapillus sp.]|uniref:hypothetical protein n=1 Tax=Thiolapillus sp. TaxID=2017437 RepID=UPI003AF73815